MGCAADAMPLPPDLAALSRPNHGPLQAVTVRLGEPDLAAVDALRRRLNGPSRGALLRSALNRGLAAIAAELEAAA